MAARGGHRDPSTRRRHRSTTSTPTPQQTPNPPSLPSSSSSSEHLPQLPFDLIPIIILRLPLKSILRCSCVCKSWNALISDPQFAKHQFRSSPVDPTRNHHHHLIVSQSGEFLLRDFYLPSVFNRSIVSSSSHRRLPLPYISEGIVFSGSCHGMLLCVNNGGTRYFLWNPTTGKFKDLPSLKNDYYVSCGFGYDHFSDSYKAVAVVCNDLNAGDDPEWDIRVMVHTLGTDLWKEIQGFPDNVSIMCRSGKFVNGAVNWLAMDYATGDSKVIGSLDLVTERYHQQLLPLDCRGEFNVLNLALLKSCLCVLCSHGPVSDVWLMKEYGNKESWTKVFSYRYAELPQYDPYTLEALCMSDGGDELLLELDEGLVVFNSKNDTFRTISGIQSFGTRIVAGVYVESLISP